MESNTTTSSISQEEEFQQSEQLILSSLESIFSQNEDQVLIEGIDILLTLVGKYSSSTNRPAFSRTRGRSSSGC